MISSSVGAEFFEGFANLNTEHQPSVPHISVIIATYNAPTDMRRCLESLVTVSYPSWDIIVVDQSVDQHTEAVVDNLRGSLPALTYIHPDQPGKTRACNTAMEDAEGTILAFLDHDCTTGSTWLDDAVAVFMRWPGAALVFGAVVSPAGHDSKTVDGWLPTSEGWMPPVERATTATGFSRARLDIAARCGMGCCMFIRADRAREIGPFDPYLGPGTAFPAHEDTDYAHRLFRTGHTVVQSPRVVVEHYGFRSHDSGASWAHMREYERGIAGWHAKALRAGEPFAAFWIVDHLARLTKPILRNLSRTARATRGEDAGDVPTRAAR